MSTWWVMKYAPNGRGFLVDIPFPSEVRADRYVETKCEGEGRVFETTSSDKKVAAREIRAQLSERADPKVGWGKNFKHK